MRNDRLAGRTLGLSRRFPVALLYTVKSQGLTLQATRVSGINTIQLLGFQLIAASKEAITVCERNPIPTQMIVNAVVRENAS